MKRKTNFDQYLEEQLKDEGFAERFKKAGKAYNGFFTAIFHPNPEVHADGQKTELI